MFEKERYDLFVFLSFFFVFFSNLLKMSSSFPFLDDIPWKYPIFFALKVVDMTQRFLHF